MRYRDGRRSICVSLAVRLPADLHVLRHRHDEVRPQPDGVRRSSTRRCTSAASRTVDHCVFMGMGEPMMNLDNVLGPAARLPDARHHPPPHGDLDRRLDPRASRR